MRALLVRRDGLPPMVEAVARLSFESLDVADDLKAGLASFKQNPCSVVLLVSDGEDSAERSFCRRVRRAAGQMAVGILTLLRDTESTTRFGSVRHAQPSDFISAPFSQEELAVRIKLLKGRVKQTSEPSVSQRDLFDAQKQLDELESLASIGSWSWHLPSGAVQWSAQLFRHFGLEKDTFPPSFAAFLELVHAEDREEAQRTIADALATLEPFEFQMRVERSDGQLGWMRNRGHVLPNDKGAAERVVGTIQDVTEQRRLEAQMLRSQKLESIGRLTGGIAHDFNNLLTVISSYAGLMLLDPAMSDEGRDSIETIGRASRRAAALTEKLLAFSRRQVREPVVMDLNRAIDGTRQLVERLLGDDVKVNFELGRGAGNVRADPGQIEQILMNLAVNARDAMPKGGLLRIHTQRDRVDAALATALGDIQPGSFAVLTVEDTGTGMSEGTLERIFDPFFTTKAFGEGTGLGLATVHGIVRQHGGVISVTSREGEGTRFVVYLPSAREPAEPRTTGMALMLGSSSRGLILLAEDDPLVRKAVIKVLRDSGFKIVWGGDGREALEAAASSGEVFDALLTDVMMPDMGGAELARVMRERQPGIPVLFMSGLPSEELLQIYDDDESVGFVAKPFIRESLPQRLSSLIQNAKARER